MANPFVHVELHTDGVDKAKAFYGELLDWKLEDVPMGDTTYTMVGVGDGTSGGMMTNPVPDGLSHWVAYVSVDNAATATEKAQELGAKIVVPKTEVPGMGWFSIITDPTGATVGLWEAKQ